MWQRRLIAVAACAAALGLLADVARPGGGVRAQTGQPRLVVFEYHAVDGSNCRAGGAAIDALALRYEQENRPVVFIEYDNNVPLGNRQDRWYDAYDNQRDCPYLPLVVVDSGWRWSCGWEVFEAVYAGFVDQALANPAGAELSAWYTRAGNDLDVSIQVVNRSGRSLGAENNATLNVIVFERTKVITTARFARGATAGAPGASLPDGGQAVYRLPLTNVPVVDWGRAVVVALLDYQPHAASAQYESLQAAIAVEGPPPTAIPQPSPTSSPTATPEPSPTPSATVTAEPSPTPSATATPEDSPGPSTTATATSEGTLSPPVTETAGASATPTPTDTPTLLPPATPSGEPAQQPLYLPLAFRDRVRA